ncbi:helix-turn-helix domain-containing protein [Cellulomonas carbonis]|uniref:DNA-binding protein n=1 Tax=Cellulomonas carbonis T26 TaxID=947969 RepID=A0A0A0BV71_9CELL|nr:helix-turn-helix domain-containing protein [Cellulomonas carbonis]KGM11875.1 DNA-binding protein [Cellulomonas carbonis T26]GGB91577.1 hypothetical protein GCM10010972_00260 [Cellulomonas carbonis]
MTTHPVQGARPSTFVTVSDVARDLQVTERFVRQLIATGRLRAVKVGSRVVRIRRSDVEAILRPFGGVG